MLTLFVHDMALLTVGIAMAMTTQISISQMNIMNIHRKKLSRDAILERIT